MRSRRATCTGFPPILLVCVATLLVAATPLDATASDGVIEINQARMDAGGITPGDSPGKPVTLSQPGSYRLTSDLVVTGIHDAVILVKTSAGVTIDLNGFALRGPYACAPGACAAGGVGYGVLLGGVGEGDQVTVRNGRITGLSGACILLGAEARIENVDVSSCGEGIVVGARSHVVGVRILRTLYRGLRFTGTSALFERNVIAQTGLGNSAGQTASVVGGTATGGNVCEDGLCRPNLARRRFYLTRTVVQPTGAPTACAAGFHFASLWELHEPSHLDYDQSLGRSVAGGVGPPVMYGGWIRTGAPSDSTGAAPGFAQCSFWSTNDPSWSGTYAGLFESYTGTPSDPATHASPWLVTTKPCSSVREVWCVED